MNAPQLNANSTIDEILHGLITAGIMAASIFVKNPNSRQHAASIINVVNSTVLPLADDLLSKQAAAATPATK